MLVVVGSLNRDVVLQVPHLPLPGETLAAGSVEEISGGKGANQAVAAARLQHDVHLIGCVGDDAAGRWLREEVVAADVRDQLATSSEPTGTAYICVAAGDSSGGENHIVLHAGANAALTPEHIAAHESLISQADGLLVQLEVPLPTVREALAIARRHRVRTILDPAPAVPLDDELLGLVDIVSPNQSEAAVLVGDVAPSEQIDRLQSRHGCAVVLKRGHEGAVWSQPGHGPLEQAALPVDVVDTTAAGDAFTAALAVALAEGRSPSEALRWACATGSLAVTKAGAQPSLPTRDAVEAALGEGGRPE